MNNAYTKPDAEQEAPCSITYARVRENAAVRTYIDHADAALLAIGYTEHGVAHCTRVADTAEYILSTLEYAPREIELARVAGYMHDIGNLVNRVDHAQSGALMAFRLLEDMGANPNDIATVVTAIGNHDEHTAEPLNAVTAALIIADKTDVRRSRVRNPDTLAYDIHDRVNYATRKSQVKINEERTLLKLKLFVDTRHSAVMDYFEIFLDRMLLCRRAAEKLHLEFKLIINEQQLL